MMTQSLPGRVSRPALLSTLWIFLLLNLIFRDIHEFLRPGFLHEAMTGTLNGTELTDELFLVAGILLEVPIAMVLLSRVLPIRPNRWANISASIIALAIVVGGNPQDMDDMFFAVVEAIALGMVLLVAWTWRTPLDISTGNRVISVAARSSVPEALGVGADHVHRSTADAMEVLMRVDADVERKVTTWYRSE